MPTNRFSCFRYWTAGCLAVVAVSLAACAGSPLAEANQQAAEKADVGQYVIDTPFDEAEHQRAMRPGRSSVVGAVVTQHKKPQSLFWATDPKAGVKVYLVPLTTYNVAFQKAWKRVFPQPDLDLGPVPGRPIPVRDPRAARYTRETTTDKFGRYAFNGLAPGKYRVSAEFNHVFYSIQRFNIGSSQTNYGSVSHYQDREVPERVSQMLEEEVKIDKDGQQVEASFSKRAPRKYSYSN